MDEKRNDRTLGGFSVFTRQEAGALSRAGCRSGPMGTLWGQCSGDVFVGLPDPPADEGDHKQNETDLCEERAEQRTRHGPEQ